MSDIPHLQVKMPPCATTEDVFDELRKLGYSPFSSWKNDRVYVPSADSTIDSDRKRLSEAGYSMFREPAYEV
jgi:hypothetical protein